MTHEDFPPILSGPRIEPDRPKIEIELNCSCGAILEHLVYMDPPLIKIVVAPCRCQKGVEP